MVCNITAQLKKNIKVLTYWLDGAENALILIGCGNFKE